jgi:hypothetical protein
VEQSERHIGLAAAGFVAGARPTGMFTSPKLTDPFHVVRNEQSILPWDVRASTFLGWFLQAIIYIGRRGRSPDDREPLAGRGRGGHADPAYLTRWTESGVR